MLKRPHLLIFNPDEWRGDVLGHLGNPAATTPNLDRIVETDAVSFRQAFCQNPVSTPSRCSFMSGWYPHVRGHRTMHHMLRRGEPVLLKRLKDAGYYVWWGGKNDLVPAQHGYQAFCTLKFEPAEPPGPTWGGNESAWRGEPGSDTYYSFYAGLIPTPAGAPYYYDHDWAMVRGAIDLINNPPADQPLCIFLALAYPHPPYAVEDPWFSMIDREKLPPRIPTPMNWTGKPSLLKGISERQLLTGWTEDRWDALRATYYGMCARVDHQFGMVISALKQAGLYEDTAIFFLSDHGDFAGDYGLVEKTQNTFEDCLTRVPFIFKPPSWVAVRPGIRDAMVELVDFPATVEALTGLEQSYTHFGRSLLPLLDEPTEMHRDAVFCEGGRLHGETHCMELPSSSSMNPQGLYWPRLSWQVAEGPEHTKAVMCRTQRFKYVYRLYESDELYDLYADPGELHNRIEDPALACVLAALKERLLTFFVETCDVVPFDSDRRW